MNCNLLIGDGQSHGGAWLTEEAIRGLHRWGSRHRHTLLKQETCRKPICVQTGWCCSCHSSFQANCSFSRIFNEDKIKRETEQKGEGEERETERECECVCVCVCVLACHFLLDSYWGAQSAVKSTITVVYCVMTALGRLVTTLANDRHGEPVCVCV